MSAVARRSYTDAEKAEALALYEQEGPTAVQTKLGIAKATVAGWAAANGVRTVRCEQTAAATEAARVQWDERRVALAHRIGAVAEMALDQAEANIVAGRTRDAKDAATTMAILVDKAQLLSGGSTGRHEVGGLREEVLDAARSGALRLVS